MDLQGYKYSLQVVNGYLYIEKPPFLSKNGYMPKREL